MRHARRLSSRVLCLFVTLAVTAAFPVPLIAEDSEAQSAVAVRAVFEDPSVFVSHFNGRGRECREADHAEMREIIAALENRDLDLETIKTERKRRGTSGLTITLRGTSQLNGNAQAKAAFVEAAALWEEVIGSEMSFIIEADFGPTFFGTPYPSPNIIGATASDRRTFSYTTVRDALVSHASGSNEMTIVGLLPTGSVPTDQGSATSLSQASPVYRALGVMAADQPTTEATTFMGFNSAFPFDFDPSNGIDSNKMDFVGVAAHEIGHALGFISSMGDKELNPSNPVRCSTWDLYRFDKTVTEGSFTATPRRLKAGGTQRMWAGKEELLLSTGRVDGSGGDGQQSSHWKADDFTGVYIGIMDPTTDFGQMDTLTVNDLHALDMMGFLVGHAPEVGTITGDLNGDVLSLSGNASDSDGDIASVQVSLINGAGTVVNVFDPIAIDPDGSGNFSVDVPGQNAFLSALQADVVVIDAAGNQSEAFRVDFSLADSGGPVITVAIFDGKKIKITGSGYGTNAAVLQFEVNGVLLSGQVKLNSAATKAKVKGDAGSLNIVSGSNRVAVYKSGARSNLLVFTN